MTLRAIRDKRRGDKAEDITGIDVSLEKSPKEVMKIWWLI